MEVNLLLDDDENQKLYVLLDGVGVLFWEACKRHVIQMLEDNYQHDESLKYIIEDVKKI
jgi:hypothetical protein